MKLKEAFELAKQDRLQSYTKWYKETEAAKAEWLPDLPDEFNVNFDPYSIDQFQIPFNRKLMAELPGIMNEQGWKTKRIYDEKKATLQGTYPSQEYSKLIDGREQYITFIFVTWAEGATCKRKEVGKKTVEVPIYEFNCEGVNNG